MANVATNIHSYGDPTSEIYWAPRGTAFPTSPLPTAVGAGWNALGWLADTGIQEIPSITETKKYAMQGSALVATLRSQAERSFNFECLEDNANVLTLTRPGSSVSSAGGTNAVQTITIGGSPAGGTFVLHYGGQSTAAIAFDATTSAVDAALEALSGVGVGNVSVTGTAGTSYAVAFTGALASQPVSPITATASFTGGSSPTITVAQTTPGVAPVNTTLVKPFTSQDLRSWIIDLVTGSGVHRRFLIDSGEAVLDSAGWTYKADDLTIYKFKLNCYPNPSTGEFYKELNDSPVLTS